MMRLNRSRSFYRSLGTVALVLSLLSAGSVVSVQPAAAQQQADAGTATQPFPPLEPAALAQLQQILAAWEQQSKATKTLECTFQVWHFDTFAAPAGVHATKGDGVIRYAAPDKGLFRVDRKVFYKGMKDEKPTYEEEPGQFGEHWVCNGQELIEFDRGAQECRVQQLPPEMQGQQIFNSPLPFVFNLDARQIQERYWVRQVASPDQATVLLEAWPKRQVDRAQYKVVQIALDTSTFSPRMLRMFAPNFHDKLAPKWDHYQFDNVKRNSVGAGITQFLRTFIDEKPPANWKVLRDTYRPPVDEPQATAAVPPAAGQPTRF